MDKYTGKTGDIILIVIASFFLLFVIWANLATLEKVIRGEGKVVASTKNQVIQNLEGGIVKDIFVKAGDIVEEGDSLLEFDDTFLRSELDASKIELKNLKIEVSFLEKSRELIFEELDILEPLVEQGAESRMELIRVLQRKANAESEISRKQADIESLEERIPAIKDRVNRTNVISPKAGIINRMVITTIGGVAEPGSALVEIVPLNEDLIVEVEINPKDIALVLPGQRAIVKLTAFDFSKFGSLEGKVMSVGADSIQKDDGSLWYLCEISVRVKDITSLGKEINMLPGMVAQVDIVNGERSVMNYLLQPVTKVTEEAFREI
ncbi:HlyD family efflux transporter periplasmic adaptor subunit [Gammaproteobacteria bacterium]|nr:HlyD family efflux transporter periplasmic adaptor subunit [Gammaproteobacteria bacterium]